MTRDQSPALHATESVRDLRARFRAASASSWSPTIEPLLRPGARLDPLGLATVLTYGYALSTRTVIESVESDAIDPSGFADSRAPSDAEIVDLALDAVRRHLDHHGSRGAPVVLLSGGRDSRLILLASLALGRRPRAVLTLDQRGDQSDAAIAERLADRKSVV